MTIAILPARLANQIAAGEVVERPASVVKELVENSLDAGATIVKIDIEKGGAKRIRINDDGKGIVKNELSLALSRHATSKIKDLDDLEAISSLGFRGEALASVSSVARLTLTSKPVAQESAWQAKAEGRDMAVTVQPAAHPNGTTIDVCDLFFNTPARRKFLRTEKTEFAHIEEVIKRIALACFNVTFVLSHNQKVVKQYRAANSAIQRSKRVAQICGQRFIDHAIEIDCQHDGLHLHGWIATPSYSRNQNDLSYSYVNGRMMRDKLINHAIRQAYAEMLPSDTYPAFVLFLNLDFRDVDVNVHPAKHEVRFHQGRYIHDFIYSVCHRGLNSELEPQIPLNTEASNSADVSTPTLSDTTSYIAPLRPEQNNNQYQSNSASKASAVAGASSNYRPSMVSQQESKAYSDLMTPLAEDVATTLEVNEAKIPQSSIGSALVENAKAIPNHESVEMIQWLSPCYAVIRLEQSLRLLSLKKLETITKLQLVKQRWYEKFISQPLLLPVKLNFNEKTIAFIQANLVQFEHLGFIIQLMNKSKIQIRQFPALLRNKDVTKSFDLFISELNAGQRDDQPSEIEWQLAFSQLMIAQSYDHTLSVQVWRNAQNHFNCEFEQQLRLNSVVIDLTSSIKQLT
jgi:DNA mismatch repair protein MutL